MSPSHRSATRRLEEIEHACGGRFHSPWPISSRQDWFSIRMRLLVARLWLWAVVLRPLKHVIPLVTLVRLMRRRAAGGPARPEVVGRLDRVFRSEERFPRRAPSNCMERALGAYRLLCRAGVRPELVVGMRRGANGAVDGHTWVVVDGRPVGEDEAWIAGFTRVMAFDASGHRTSGPPRLPHGLRVA